MTDAIGNERPETNNQVSVVQEGLEENRLTWRQARAMVANTETLRSCAGNYQIFPIRSLSSGARALHSVNASELSEKFAPTA